MILIRTHEKDNVAVAFSALEKNRIVALPWGGEIRLSEDIPASHKVALKEFQPGETVYRYGQPIGEAAVVIEEGGLVHTHNIIAPDPDKTEKVETASENISPLTGPDSFPGFARDNGPAGIRNHVLVLPTVACANGVVRSIGMAMDEVVPLEHGYGCGRAGQDHRRTSRVLTGCATNPNVGAVLIISLGCEGMRGDRLADAVASTGRPVERLVIQESGGSLSTIKKGLELARKLAAKIKDRPRVDCPMSDLILGLQCGGSDAMSGITANPLVGLISDWLAEKGGTSVLSETTEMIGTMHILEERARNPEVAGQIHRMISENEEVVKQMLGEHAHLAIAPGNMDGGLSTIMEKSLGCITKGGVTPINEVVGYGEVPAKKGLVLMDGPGYDIESIGGLVAGGAQMLLFTTGRGTPVGTPITPTIKIASNSRLFKNMCDDMDINAGRIADGEVSLTESGQVLLDLVLSVAAGDLTRAEANAQEVIGFSMTTIAL